jgi:putative redox protein
VTGSAGSGPPSPAPPPVAIDLAWRGALRLEARAGAWSLTVDGERAAGPSPVQLLAAALAGCMALDVVDIVRKGRHPFTALAVRIEGERAAEHPRRLVRVALHFAVTGDVPPDRLERAIQLSRDRYCSVWHSLRQDIALATTFEIAPA